MRRQINLRMLTCCFALSLCGKLMRVRVPNSGERRHFAVISQSRETSWAQPCEGNGNGLACKYEVEGQGDVRVSKCHL